MADVMVAECRAVLLKVHHLFTEHRVLEVMLTIMPAMPRYSGNMATWTLIEKNNLDTVYETDEQSDHSKEDICHNTRNGMKKYAFAKHKESFDLLQAQQDLEYAQNEWEQVENNIPSVSLNTVCLSNPVTYEEVQCYFQSKDMQQYLAYIKPVRQRKGFDAVKHWLFGPPKLNASLIPERDLIFAIAQCPFDTSDTLHVRVLQTLYKELTGVKLDCPRYGGHWEDIGFQGSDPATDLRGVGFLGLVHLLYLVLNLQTRELSKEISRLSHNELQDFPFCVMGINMTRIVLETLREEVLNKECNRKGAVQCITNEFYAGIYLHLYQIWRDQKKTIMDSGYVLRDVCSFAKRYPHKVFQQLADYYQGKLKSPRWISDVISFTDIGDLSHTTSSAIL